MKINRKIFRTILNHKAQYLGAALLVALSSMIFTMFGIFGVNIMDNLDNFRIDYHQEDAFFIPVAALSDTKALESEYSVKMEERYYQDIAYQDGVKLRLLSATDEIDLYYVLEGKELTGDDEILLDPGFAKAHGININDEIILNSKIYQVVGFVTTPDYIYALKNEGDMIKNSNTFGYAIVSENNLEKSTEATCFYSIEYSDDTDVSALKQRIGSETIVLKWVDRDDNLRITFAENDLKAVEPMGRVIPVAILIVTGVMVAVILNRLLKMEYNQIGALFAIGYRKKEIYLHYLRYALFIGIVGSIPGTIAGIAFVVPFLDFVSVMYNIPVMEVYYNPLYIFLSLLLPFVFLVPVTLYVTAKALRMSPLELLKNGNKKVKVGWLEKRIHLKRFKFKTVFKVREVLKNYSRILFLILGVVVASSFILMGFIMKSSMDDLVVKSIENGFSYDFMYTFRDFQTEEIDGTEVFSFASFAGEKENGDEINILAYGIEPDSRMVNLTNQDGEAVDFNQVIITRVLADRMGIGIGDEMRIKNNANEEEITLKVDEIADYSLGAFVFMPLEQLNEISGYEQGTYLGLYSDRELDIAEYELLSDSSRAEMLEGYKLMMEPLQTIALSIGIMSFLVGLVVLYVVISMIIMENANNISLLKILGYKKKEIYGITLSGLTFFVVISYLLAIPVMFAGLDKMFMTMTVDMTMDIPVVIDWMYILYGFVIVMIIYVIARIMNRRKVDRYSMADSLKNKSE